MQEHQEPLTKPALPPGKPRPPVPPCLPSWFSVLRHDGVAHVSIYNNIGTFNNSAADLLAAVGDAPEVEFIINSTGGDSDTAFRVHEVLAGKVRLATVSGECSSAAWILALTAKRVLMASDAHVLIHGPVAAAVGPADVLEMVARDLRKSDKRLRDLFAARAKFPDGALDTLFDGTDHELTPDECKQFGLVDELFTPRPATIRPAGEASAGVALTNAKTETEDEKLFKDLASAFGNLRVSDRATFGRWLSEWFAMKVREET